MNDFKHVVVAQQVGNTCGPHAVKNAYMALDMKEPSVDMKKIDVDSIWIKDQMAKNGSPENIIIVETSILIEKPKLMQHFIDGIFQRVASVETYAKLGIALIVNMLSTGNRLAVGHWVALSIHVSNNTVLPIRGYNSAAIQHQKTTEIAIVLYQCCLNVCSVVTNNKHVRIYILLASRSCDISLLI